MSLGANFLHTVSSLIPLDIQITILRRSDQNPCFWYDFVNFFSLWDISKLEIRKFDLWVQKFFSDFCFMGSIDRYDLYETFPRRFTIGCRRKNTDLRPISAIWSEKSRFSVLKAQVKITWAGCKLQVVVEQMQKKNGVSRVPEFLKNIFDFFY